MAANEASSKSAGDGYSRSRSSTIGYGSEVRPQPKPRQRRDTLQTCSPGSELPARVERAMTLDRANVSLVCEQRPVPKPRRSIVSTSSTGSTAVVGGNPEAMEQEAELDKLNVNPGAKNSSQEIESKSHMPSVPPRAMAHIKRDRTQSEPRRTRKPPPPKPAPYSTTKLYHEQHILSTGIYKLPTKNKDSCPSSNPPTIPPYKLQSSTLPSKLSKPVSLPPKLRSSTLKAPVSLKSKDLIKANEIHLYEDLDRSNNYEALDYNSDSSDDEPYHVFQKKISDSSGPVLPPKNASDDPPVLPPRSKPVQKKKHHRMLSSSPEPEEPKESKESTDSEPVQDTGNYEIITYCPEESDPEDYTDMSGDPRDNQRPPDYSNDGGEDVYIEMNASEYIDR